MKSLAGVLFVSSFCTMVGCRTPSSTVAPADSTATTSGSSPRPSGRTYAKPSDAELRAKLTPLQYEVTQKDATEPPFRNAYWDNHEAGLYVDVATGQPLFSSKDKFESGTGWPSFVRPIEEGAVVTKSDRTFGMARTEVRSSSGQSHLGHVFEDGPAPTHLRYCMNSAALRFIPASKLEAEGYGTYAEQVTGAPPAPAESASCTTPPPGERAGCNTTLTTALVEADANVAAALQKIPGVLEVERGSVGKMTAARVVYDPKALTYARLLDAWAKAMPEAPRKALTLTPEQKSEAEAWKREAAAKNFAIEGATESAFTKAP